mmetsp:Transcript_9452/g.24509  ORF Transcript_9452/g.24509 Transcript_9452/m.24509 type:complete len:262 (+) Transcript_9452:610-1395(+)
MFAKSRRCTRAACLEGSLNVLANCWKTLLFASAGFPGKCVYEEMNLRMPESTGNGCIVLARSPGRISVSARSWASLKEAMRASTSRSRSAFLLTQTRARMETTEVACRAPPTSPTRSWPLASWTSSALRISSVSLTSPSTLCRRSSCASSGIGGTPSGPASPACASVPGGTTLRNSKSPPWSFRERFSAGDGVPSSSEHDVRTFVGSESSFWSSTAKVTFLLGLEAPGGLLDARAASGDEGLVFSTSTTVSSGCVGISTLQ